MPAAPPIEPPPSDAATLPLPLALWLSPSFPVGAFAYSHGLEWAAEAGDVRDAESLAGWLSDILAHGAGRNDAILAAEAFRAVAAGDDDRLAEVAELAAALGSSAERRLEALTQGGAFVTTARAAWPCPALDRLVALARGEIAYPVAVATAAAGHALPLRAMLEMLVTGFLGNLVSAAVRLGIVGQTDGQRVLARLLPVCRTVAADAERASLDDLGGAVFRADLAAILHETQYTRLFRS